MTVASWITTIRFILAPLIYWEFAQKTPKGVILAIGFLLLAGITDIVDGWAARELNEVSELGKTLDPLADKIVIFASLIGLVIGWGLPGWLVGVYVVKELLQVTAGLFLLQKYQQLIPANLWGKTSTSSFFAGFMLFFLKPIIGTVFIIAGILLSIFALYTYYRAFQKLKQTK